MKRYIFLLIILMLTTLQVVAQTKNEAFVPKAVWNDTEGKPINAHGGGLLKYRGKYYWYGNATART